MSFQYIQDYYKVPAETGRRVSHQGKEGVITRAINQYIEIHFDGDKKPRGPFHPTCDITYLGMGKVPKLTASQLRWQRYRESDHAFPNFRSFLAHEKEKKKASDLGFDSVSAYWRWLKTI
jgi:hypothetical protein